MLHLVVHLFVHPGREAELLAFESQAIAVLRSHGGQLDLALRPRRHSTGSAEVPYEIHVLRIGSREAFEAFRRDPRLEELSALRASAISRTVVFEGSETVEYR